MVSLLIVKVISHLISVMRQYEACGLSGPQIGLPWQIFAIEHTAQHMKTDHEVINKVHEMKIIPVTIFINPELKVIDHTPIIFYEGCESIRGYSAAVPRAYEVEVTALNASAEQFTWRGRGWSARIVQHEYDHLQVRFREKKNILYTYVILKYYVEYYVKKNVEYKNALNNFFYFLGKNVYRQNGYKYISLHGLGKNKQK